MAGRYTYKKQYSTTACQLALLVFVSSWCVVREPMEFNHRLPCLSRPSQKKRHAWSLQKSDGKKETLENMCFVLKGQSQEIFHSHESLKSDPQSCLKRQCHEIFASSKSLKFNQSLIHTALRANSIFLQNFVCKSLLSSAVSHQFFVLVTGCIFFFTCPISV
jgi:hypothetical protein